MVIRIIGCVVGILIFIAGLYYLIKDKEDPESRRIYTVIMAVGAVIAVIAAVRLIMYL